MGKSCSKDKKKSKASNNAPAQSPQGYDGTQTKATSAPPPPQLVQGQPQGQYVQQPIVYAQGYPPQQMGYVPQQQMGYAPSGYNYLQPQGQPYAAYPQHSVNPSYDPASAALPYPTSGFAPLTGNSSMAARQPALPSGAMPSEAFHHRTDPGAYPASGKMAMPRLPTQQQSYPLQGAPQPGQVRPIAPTKQAIVRPPAGGGSFQQKASQGKKKEKSGETIKSTDPDDELYWASSVQEHR